MLAITKGANKGVNLRENKSVEEQRNDWEPVGIGGRLSPSSLSIFRNWKTDGPVKVVGLLLHQQKRGSPAPSQQLMPVPSSPIQCPVLLASLNPQGSFPLWSRLGTDMGSSAHIQTLRLLLGSVCTGSSGFNLVKS